MAFFKLAIVLVTLGVSLATETGLNDRLDCVLVEGSISEAECKNRGCIWSPINEDRIPFCYLDKKVVGYTTKGTTNHGSTIESTLELKPTAKKSTPFAQIPQLKVAVSEINENMLRIKITDPAHKRYEVPIQSDFMMADRNLKAVQDYSVTLSGDFHLNVTRRSTGATLLDTSIGGLIYSDQFIQFATYLASTDVYGFGENYHLAFKRKFDYTTLPMFARDYGVGNRAMNYYGQHPFLTVLENDGKAHGLFLLNSNAMSYTLLPSPGISLKTTGGVLDLFLFVGNNPEHVVQLYTQLIGRPMLPPFWGLGFQQCRWGYANLDAVKKVVKRTLDHKVPLDIQYMDIDYMDEYRDFTYSPKHFAGLPAFMNETKEKHGLHWTLILDPAIQADHKPYLPFDEGYKRDVFVKWPADLAKSDKIGHPANVPTDKDVLYGKVWPAGPAAFPDFFKNATNQWWKEMIKHLHKDLKFDALWIDMNEPSNFDDAKWYKCPNDKYKWKHPQMGFNEADSSKTICMDAIQGEHGEYRHYDVHSLYGLSETKPTFEGLHEATGKRGFVVSRSTFPSTGKYGSHWQGDNNSSWEQLRQSIIGMMEFSLFGISFIGADICGFAGTPTPELCRRWLQLGAYYPFSRSHNTLGAPDQDPGVWAEKGHPEVTKAARDALETRYQLLHYLYTRFYRAHVNGDTVVRPMHHVFPHDTAARNMDEQFFLGPSIMVSPFLNEKQTFVNAYVPDTSEWYQMSGDFAHKVEPVSGHVHITDAESHRPLLFTAGSILPVVAHARLPALVNTANLRKTPLQLWVLPTATGSAKGDLFFDDGESIDTIKAGNYNYYNFALEACHLTIDSTHFGYKAAAHSADILQVDSINVALSSSKAINQQSLHVTVNGKEQKASLDKQTLKIHFDTPLNLLHSKEKISIEFKNKNTNECFTH